MTDRGRGRSSRRCASGSGLRTSAWIAGAGAVVAAGTGLVLNLASIRNGFNAAADCGVGSPAMDTLVTDADAGTATTPGIAGRWSIVGYVTGGALAVTVGILFWTSRPDARRPDRPRPLPVRPGPHRPRVPGRLLMRSRARGSCCSPSPRAATVRGHGGPRCGAGGQTGGTAGAQGGLGGDTGTGSSGAGGGGTGGRGGAGGPTAPERAAQRRRKRSGWNGRSGGSNPVFVGGPCIVTPDRRAVEVSARAATAVSTDARTMARTWGTWSSPVGARWDDDRCALGSRLRRGAQTPSTSSRREPIRLARSCMRSDSARATTHSFESYQLHVRPESFDCRHGDSRLHVGARDRVDVAGLYEIGGSASPK